MKSDRRLLAQILKNLVENAVKFNNNAAKKVDIGWHQPARDGYIEIFVHDNGIGIAPRYQQQIFDIFQRLHTDREYKGTGIGLSIVRKAALSLGGDVRVESVAGEGSTFYVKIPADRCEQGSPHEK